MTSAASHLKRGREWSTKRVASPVTRDIRREPLETPQFRHRRPLRRVTRDIRREPLETRPPANSSRAPCADLSRVTSGASHLKRPRAASRCPQGVGPQKSRVTSGASHLKPGREEHHRSPQSRVTSGASHLKPDECRAAGGDCGSRVTSGASHLKPATQSPAHVRGESRVTSGASHLKRAVPGAAARSAVTRDIRREPLETRPPKPRSLGATGHA